MKKAILEYKKEIENSKLDELTLIFDNILYHENLKLLEKGENLYWMICYEDIFFLYKDSDYFLYSLFAILDDNKEVEINNPLPLENYRAYYKVRKYKLILKKKKNIKESIPCLFNKGYFQEIINIYNRFGISQENINYLLSSWYELKNFFSIIDYCEQNIIFKKEKREEIYRYYLLAAKQLYINNNKTKHLKTKYKIMFKKEI